MGAPLCAPTRRHDGTSQSIGKRWQDLLQEQFGSFEIGIVEEGHLHMLDTDRLECADLLDHFDRRTIEDVGGRRVVLWRDPNQLRLVVRNTDEAKRGWYNRVR